MKRLLVIRLSAMGDAALAVPVVTSLARQYAGDLRITVLTRQQNAPLFDWAPPTVEVLPVDTKKLKGLIALERFYQSLRQRNFDLVADLHDVLRTKFLRTRFRMAGCKVAVIDKGRKEKQALIGHGRNSAPLKTTLQRYCDVFKALGYPVGIDFTRAFDPHHENFAPVDRRIGRKSAGERWVGIAPFAAHEGKIYPLDMMREVAKRLAAKGCRVLLFGAGDKERRELESWQAQGIESMCGRLGGLHNEMLLMSKLDCMLAMDSANMHIASLVGTPVVSIWGATHPAAGFMPFGSTMDGVVQLDNLDCRPCSIYGNKPCQFADFRCLRGISVDTVVERVMNKI